MKIKQKDINLYAEFKRTNSNKIIRSEKFCLSIIITVSLAAIIAFAVSVKLKINMIEKDIISVNSRIDNAYNNKSSDLIKNKNNYDDISAAFEYISSFPDISADIIKTINQFKEVTVDSYSYSLAEGSLTINADTDSAENISEFIKYMRENSKCSDIKYSGYTFSDEKYSFNAELILSDNTKTQKGAVADYE